MRVAVVGAGGVGGFLGGLLARGSDEVSVLARGAHLAAIHERGLELRSPQVGTFSVRPRASDNPAELGQHELVLVAVKMYDLSAAAQATAKLLAPDGVALTIQNGLEAPDDLAVVVGRERVLIGTATIEAAIAEPGVIAHMVPLHQVTVSAFEGPPTQRVRDMVEHFQQAHIAAAVADDGRQALWNKFAVLDPLATLTSVADLTLGDIMAVPELQALSATLTREVIDVAQACGYDVTQPVAGYQQLVQKFAPSLPNFTSSMNRDFRAGKPTELDWLTGRLVRLADERGVGVPAHKALYALLKLKVQRAST